MFGLGHLQKYANRVIACENKKYILKKLENYYETVDNDSALSAKERAVTAFWCAKKQGRLDNLNRIVRRS